MEDQGQRTWRSAAVVKITPHQGGLMEIVVEVLDKRAADTRFGQVVLSVERNELPTNSLQLR